MSLMLSHKDKYLLFFNSLINISLPYSLPFISSVVKFNADNFNLSSLLNMETLNLFFLSDLISNSRE